MNAHSKVPVQGRAIRFGPGRDGKPAAALWKVWSEGSEVYACTRSYGGLAKISVHASGQIHYRLRAKSKQDLAPLMRLPSGLWWHAFELRFLLSDGALSPFGERESLKEKTAWLIAVQKDFALYANLVVAPSGTSAEAPLPVEFMPGAQILWQARLRDGRLALLLIRMLPLDAECRSHIAYIRGEIKPTANFMEKPPERRYVETIHLNWSANGGNVVLVTPLGDEAFRTEEDLSPHLAPSSMKEVDFHSPGFCMDLLAPNGAQVAVFEFSEVKLRLKLTKSVSQTVKLGQVHLRVKPENLIVGSKFTFAPIRFSCIPTAGGLSPKSWNYIVSGRFDGYSVYAELHQNSVALQNRNLASHSSALDDDEELSMSMPIDNICLTASTNAPSASREFVARLTLRKLR